MPTCHNCGGAGRVSKDVKISCPYCMGKGKRFDGNLCSDCRGSGLYTTQEKVTCPLCYGSGKFGPERKTDEKCFITTATTISLGKGDNCAELLAFRKFRDTYVSLHYNKDVDHYYILAPKIVSAIEKLPASKAIYASIWETYLERAYRHILNDNNTEAYNSYKKMVSELEEQFL